MKLLCDGYDGSNLLLVGRRSPEFSMSSDREAA